MNLEKLDDKKTEEIISAVEKEYCVFREKVGKIAAEYHVNPFDLLIAHLEASVEDEKERKKRAEKNINHFVKGLAAIVGVDADDLKNGHVASIGVSKEQVKKIIDILTEDDSDEKADDK